MYIGNSRVSRSRGRDAEVANLLQMRVPSQAGGAGRGLASSLNIAAFNLGNAFGAGLGGPSLGLERRARLAAA